jgi:UDP-N-acetylenolpyruvoylglucosamine reductase
MNDRLKAELARKSEAVVVGDKLTTLTRDPSEGYDDLVAEVVEKVCVGLTSSSTIPGCLGGKVFPNDDFWQADVEALALSDSARSGWTQDTFEVAKKAGLDHKDRKTRAHVAFWLDVLNEVAFRIAELEADDIRGRG